jgi:hypothetical protein
MSKVDGISWHAGRTLWCGSHGRYQISICLAWADTQSDSLRFVTVEVEAVRWLCPGLVSKLFSWQIYILKKGELTWRTLGASNAARSGSSGWGGKVKGSFMEALRRFEHLND